MKRVQVAIAVVFREGKLLICQRKQDADLGGFWEFPGGKIEPGESAQQCLHRELMEEVGIRADVVSELPIIQHEYPTVHIQIQPFLCRHVEGEARPIECTKIDWIEPAQLNEYAFPPANAALIDDLIHRRI
jgi:mutator protein MutT